MTARNLKIRITVGHEEGRQPRRVATPPKPMDRAASPGRSETTAKKPVTKLAKWAGPIVVASALVGGLWFVLPSSEESNTPSLARVESKNLSTSDRVVPPNSEQTKTPAQAGETPALPDIAMSRAEPENRMEAAGAREPAAETAATADSPPSAPDAVRGEAETGDVSTPGAIGAPMHEESANIPSTIAAPPAPARNADTALPTSDKVSRATFATAISRLEPVESIDGILPAERGLSRLYFFTELRGLNGQRIRHRWLINGQRIADIPVNVSSDRFRASSNMRLSKNRLGTWEVQVVDRQGNVLHASRLEYR